MPKADIAIFLIPNDCMKNINLVELFYSASKDIILILFIRLSLNNLHWRIRLYKSIGVSFTLINLVFKSLSL